MNNSQKLHFTYHIIACFMRGNPCKADANTKALAKATRDYLLDVLNKQNKGGTIYDPVIASQAFNFFGHALAWNANRWERSADIVYKYFKAKTIIEKIKEYDKVAGKSIVDDYLALLNFLFCSLEREEEINYDAAPGINENLLFVPTCILKKVEQKFKLLFE